MTNARTAAQSSKSPIVRLFEQSRPTITSLPAVRTILGGLAGRCSSTLRESYLLQATTSLVQLSQGPIGLIVSERPEAVSVAMFVPEWNDCAVISIDGLLFFRLLDSLYGGNASLRTAVPVRPLTTIERSVATRLASSLIAHMQSLLNDICKFSFQAVRILEEPDPILLDKGRDKYLIALLRVVEFDAELLMAIPLAGLELAREALSVSQKEADQLPDPNWTQQFKKSVTLCKVGLLATASGPHMVLNEVAELRPGLRLEFSGESLRNVRIESGGRPVFIGRLGQTKGHMTIFVEEPAPQGPREDADA